MTKIFNFNMKILKCSLSIVLLLAYILPYQLTDGIAVNFGYPVPFVTTYGMLSHGSLLTSASINIITLTIDVLIVYFVINFVGKRLEKMKLKRRCESL